VLLATGRGREIARLARRDRESDNAPAWAIPCEAPNEHQPWPSGPAACTTLVRSLLGIALVHRVVQFGRIWS
jgi:hypothetical protein